MLSHSDGHEQTALKDTAPWQAAAVWLCPVGVLSLEHGSRRKIPRKVILAAAVLASAAVLLLLLAGLFYIKEVTVVGNEHYSNEEIADFVIGEGYRRNTIYLYLRYKYQKHPEIPFVDDFEVHMDSLDSITIRVYEKNIVGYVRYLGKNVYFDKDGIVVESSDEEIEGVPLISGLYFDQLALYQSLNVEEPQIFDTILEITQLLTKYSLDPDELFLGNLNDIYLQLKDVRVTLGSGDHMEEKIARIKQLEPDLLDKSGTLDMKNYTDESTHISLESNRQ